MAWLERYTCIKCPINRLFGQLHWNSHFPFIESKQRHRLLRANRDANAQKAVEWENVYSKHNMTQLYDNKTKEIWECQIDRIWIGEYAHFRMTMMRTANISASLLVANFSILIRKQPVLSILIEIFITTKQLDRQQRIFITTPTRRDESKANETALKSNKTIVFSNHKCNTWWKI